MTTLIFANGSMENYTFYKSYLNKMKPVDLIICVDGGMRHTYALDLVPHIIIGDLDSASLEILNFYKEKLVPIHTYPTKKDKTDLQIAVEYAIEHKAKEIVLLGGFGTRFDHSLGNAHILSLAVQTGVTARMINEHNCVQLIDKEIHIYGEVGDIVSLIPLTTQVEGVCTQGLEYPLKDATLMIGTSYGISNVMISTYAKIKIRTGLLYVIQAID